MRSELIHTDRSSLLAAARAGDADARERLVSAHLDTVRAVCGSRLRSPHDVADATQETFVRALARLDQVRDAGSLDAWLRAIAVRVCADQGRQRLRAISVADPGGDTPSEWLGPSELAVAGDEADRLHATLATLGARDRQALWMRDAIGLPVASVAADLGLTEGSARVLLARARERLRAAYQGVAGIAAIGLLRLRGRVAGTGAVDVRLVAAAQLAIVAVAVGTVLPGAPSPAEGADAGRTAATAVAPDLRRADVAVPDPAAAIGDVAGASGGPAAAASSAPSRPAPPDAPVVVVGSSEPAGPSKVGVATSDGSGEVAGIEFWGGPVADAAGDHAGEDGSDGDASDDDPNDDPDDDRLPLGPLEIVPGGVGGRD